MHFKMRRRFTRLIEENVPAVQLQLAHELNRLVEEIDEMKTKKHFHYMVPVSLLG